MKKITSLLVLITFFATFLQAQTPKELKSLEKKLTALLDASMAPGYAVAVVKGDSVVYSQGFGYSNVEKKEKVDAHTLFAIGSTSKAFTTALLGIMAEEKGLSFQDSPREYLPELKFFNDQLNTELTIEDLVCHRSGLPRHDFSWYLFPTESKKDLLKRVAHHENFADLRTKWYYNNFGYLIQGMITEKLTGKSWEDNIRERFFTPLNMTRSNLTIAELQTFSNIATGYELVDFKSSKAMKYFNIAAISPAGSINSSVNDMSKWLKVWLNEGKYEGKQILPASYLQKATQPLFTLGSGIADPKFPSLHLQSYGYAWFVSSYKGHYRMEHGGNIDGFSANVALFPSDEIGIVVLCNQDGSLLPAMARDLLADHFLGVEQTDWVKQMEEKMQTIQKMVESKKDKAEEERVQGTHFSHPISDYSGKYFHPGYGSFTIENKGDTLVASFTERSYQMKHWHYDVFKLYEVKEGKVEEQELGIDFIFEQNVAGKIAGVKIKFEPTLAPILFERSALVSSEEINLFQTYAGAYVLKGMTLVVKNKGDGNLTLDVPGQPQYTLIPESENEFYLEGLDGFRARFVQVEEGSVELHMLQPNGTFVAKKSVK
jgi:CubicO group peptidase (beta-lactamase class C family)